MSDAHGSGEMTPVPVPPPPSAPLLQAPPAVPPPPPSAPGPIPPPPAYAAASYPQPSHPVPPPAPPAARPRRSHLLAWVTGGVVAALVLAGGGVAAYRLVLGAEGATAGDFAPIADIAQEPDTLWEWTPDASSEIADYVSPAGGVGALDGTVVVVSTYFDQPTWFSDRGYSPDWYPAYDEQYDSAHSAGVLYSEAMSAYYEDLWAPWPDPSEYLPNGMTEEDLYLSENRGYSDGFYDGQYGSESRLVGPPAVDFSPEVVGLRATDGSALWTHRSSDEVELDPAIDGYLSLLEVPGGDRVAYWANTYDTEAGTSTGVVTILDATTGDPVDSVTFDDAVSSVVATADTLVVALWAEDGAVVTALAADDLSGEPLWEEDSDGSELCLFAADVVAAGSSSFALGGWSGAPSCAITGVQDFFAVADGSRGLHLRTGDEISYTPVGAGYLQEDVGYDDETGSADGEAMLVDREGTDLWDEPLPIDDRSFVQVVGGQAFYGDFSDDADWVFIDPKNGEAAWDDEVTEGRPIAVHGGAVVVQGERSLTWFDLKTGEETFHVRSGSGQYWGQVAESAHYLYLSADDELRAFSPADEDDVWSYDLDPDTWLHQVGDRLYAFTDSVAPLG